jgi:4-hydroxyphenylacetate 3-monooxygenase
MTVRAVVSTENSKPFRKAVPLRTGLQFLESLNDGRAIFVNGERVKNVATHPAFAEGARSAAQLFDIAADPLNRECMTYTSPTSGGPVYRGFQIPRSHADLRAKRLACEMWSEATFGLMGRTPDHVSNFFAGFAAAPEVFAAGGQHFADNVVSFYEHLRENHLWATYAIVPPQIDRSKASSQQADPTMFAGVVKETDGGIYISGSQQLATGGVYSDWIQISCIQPLRPGDENHAISVAVPVNVQGLRLYPRRPYALQATNKFDYPLTSRFDETDCFVVLDNVFVPWEQVFVYRNIEICRDQWWKTPSHLYGNHQAQARYATKLRFMIGLAKRINEITGNEANPAVQAQMGELAALVMTVEAMLEAQEVRASVDEKGVLWPDRATLYAVMALQSENNPRMINIIRELSGASMITMPSSLEDLESEETKADMEKYMGSGVGGARERMALMRMAWDFVGTEFGNRHQQYEKFYGGASYIVKMNMFRNYDFKRAGALVDRALALPE